MFAHKFLTHIAIAVAAALISGGAVYLGMKNTPVSQQATAPLATGGATTPQPLTACALLLDTNQLDVAAVLERIIIWSDIVSPWFVAHTDTDIRMEGEALRADGARARELYANLVGREYSVPDAAKKYGLSFIPSDNPFANAPAYLHTSMFAGMIAVADRELYTMAGYAADKDVARFAEGFAQRRAGYKQPEDTAIPEDTQISVPGEPMKP